VNSKEELWECYDRTGTLAMTLQEFIDFTEYVRCYCVGRKEVLVMPYDPKNRRYLQQEELTIPRDLKDRIVRDTILINETLGYDLNTVEFAIKDGVPYAIDFTNPAPDADIWSVTEPYFNWITDAVARMLVDYAKSSKPTGPNNRWHRWYKWLNPEMREETAEFVRGAAVGASRVARKASSAISDVIDEITEPIKPKRARKTNGENVKKSTKSGTTRAAKAGKSAKKSNV